LSATVLIIDVHADIYGKRLRAEFPALQVIEARDHSELPDDLSAVDVIVSFGIAINDGIIARAGRLRWIQSLATGVDHFLRCPSLKPDVLITSGRGIHGPPMREHVLYMMMAVGRDVTRQVNENKAHVWGRRMWSMLHGKTAVIAGVGVIGSAIGELLKQLGMHVVGVTRTPRTLAGFDEMIPTTRLREAAAMADYLINVLPADAPNIAIFGREVFAAMKPTAYYINAGRGQTVDEAALVAALRERRIAGAALDVFDAQPLPPDHPLWDLPNVFITSHLGGYVVEYEDFVLPIVVENMRLFLAGRQSEMQNIVGR
jgi:phosphoglycerate dehydrogenase-like enzyme